MGSGAEPFSEDAPGLVQRAARIAGLDSFEPPTLEAVESRRLQLWVLTLVLLLAVAGGLVLLVFFPAPQLPRWLSPGIVRYGLIGLTVLFSAYALEKEVQLRRLTGLLVQERVLTAALTNRLREVGSLLEAGKAINLGLDLEEVLSTIVRCARELLEGRDGSIMLVAGGRELRTVATVGLSSASGARVAFGQGIAGRVAATSRPLLITGALDHTHPSARVHDRPAPSSAMSVPLLHRGTLLGVLNINADPGRTYTEHDLRALSLFGEQAAAAIANAQLYQAQRLMASQKMFQALHDSLTRLPNRALFVERAERALARPRAQAQRVALLFIDLDDFQRINDSLGHGVGDEVLIAFSDRVRSILRSSDTLARCGGDEFGVLVEDVTAPDELVATAERILSALDEPFDAGHRQVRLTGSVGIAFEVPGETDRDELLRNADTALHAAKSQGKGRIVIFEPSMHHRALRRLDLESALRQALQARQLVVHFQPICRISDGEPLGVEALVRWQHPERGLLPASAFVPFAEHAGILHDIDRWVLGEACAVARRLGGLYPAAVAPWVHVNLSPSRLHDLQIVSEVAAALEKADLPPGQITLEITEGAGLGDSPGADATLAHLKALGVRLALDDFGTGYSSLSYVRRFPVDAVKIDRAFVDGLTRDAGTTALVQAILKLGNGLSLDVIAEGIERQDQADQLLELGCVLGQGWLLSRPLTADEVVAFFSGQAEELGSA